MTTPTPEHGGPLLQDFLYVDLPRVRSLLGQLYSGLPDKVEEVKERLTRWGIGADLKLAKVDFGKQTAERGQETRSLGDLHFAMFEQAAEATGFLRDISDVASSTADWNSGKVHEQALEGTIIRVTAEATITDARHFVEMIEKISAIGIAGNSAEMLQIGAMVSAMYTQGITLRILPLGSEAPNHCFVGTLLERSDHIEPERSSLYSRYGTGLREWTTVAIVARQGDRSNGQPQLNFDDIISDGTVDRGKFESLLKAFVVYMESMGLTEAPVYPGLSIIPLAVYRTIAPTAFET